MKSMSMSPIFWTLGLSWKKYLRFQRTICSVASTMACPALFGRCWDLKPMRTEIPHLEPNNGWQRWTAVASFKKQIQIHVCWFLLWPNKNTEKKNETNGVQRIGTICKNQSLCPWNHLCFIVLKRLCQLFRPLRQVLQCWKSPARMPMPSRTPNLLTPPDLKIWEQKMKWSWNDIYIYIIYCIYHVSMRIYI